MTQDTPIKKYPATTGEVARMLGIEHPASDLPMGTFTPRDNHPIADLPVAESENRPPVGGGESDHKDVADTHPLPAPVHFDSLDSINEKSPSQAAIIKVAKTAAPFVAVFSVGLFLYYFFFTGVNFGALFNSAPKTIAPKETALQQLEKQDLAAYQAWMHTFYYDITDAGILDPEADNSGNGLSNFQKYLLKLNPKSYDSLGLGMADSEAIAAGIDPITGAALTDAKKSIIAKYVDMEVVSNRMALSRLQHPSATPSAVEAVAGASVNTNTGVFSRNGDISNPVPVNSPNSNSNSSSIYGNELQLDTVTPGRLEIPDLKINAPIIWSQSPSTFDKDLQTGVIHYPGTAVPGQIGTTYISGHSSNYVWAKGSYNQIFSHLGDLPNNTSFKITVVQQNGRNAVFHYVVTHRKEYSPTDAGQYQNTGKSVVALSTCWPVGSTAKRLVVFGELTQVEK